MSEARQQALETATTPWIVFIDSDCRVPRGWARQANEMINGLSPRTEIWAFGGPSLLKGWSLQHRTLRILGGTFPGQARISVERFVDHLPASQLFLRREAVLAAGGFPVGWARTGEDMALSVRMRAAGGKLLLTRGPALLHAQNGGFRNHMNRMRRYGSVHGALARRNPRHALSKRFLPLLGLAIFLMILSVAPAQAAFAIVALPVVAARGNVLLGAWLVASAFSYAAGTAEGLVFGTC